MYIIDFRKIIIKFMEKRYFLEGNRFEGSVFGYIFLYT